MLDHQVQPVEFTFEDHLGRPRLLSKRQLADGSELITNYDAQTRITNVTRSERIDTSRQYDTYHLRIETQAPGSPNEQTKTIDYLEPETDLITRMSEPSVSP